MQINKTKENIVKIVFLALATIPLLKPNYNSIIIIIFTIICISINIKTKQKNNFNKKNVILTLPFFMFLFYEILFNSFDLSRVLLELPFLIFPFLLILKPYFINKKTVNLSFNIFQVSVLLQSVIYLFIFLKKNSIDKILNISNANIPFFREYVTGNYLIEIHPTYFSSFLLFSITISFFKFNSNKFLNSLNLIISSLFVILFSSRIIIIILILTILSFIVFLILKNNKKTGLTLGLAGITIFILIFNTKVVKERFLEIKEHINKPIVGNYYNSSNTRLAIYKCDYLLIKKIPFIGFGANLQKQLNKCYADNNDSEFYKISVFNTHNYYLYLILYGGWFFFIFFMIYLFFIFNRIKNNTLHLFIFFQILLINLTENYFSRHYGVVLFCYFTMLFIIINNNERNSKSKYF